MMNFSVPELDVRDIRSVQLYSVGKPMKFCVLKDAKSAATSKTSATQPSTLERDQADHSYYSPAPEKTPGDDDETGRSSADSDQSYLTSSTGKATGDPERGRTPGLLTEYSFGTDVEREAPNRESQPVSHSAVTHATEKTLRTETETGGRSVPPGKHESQADLTCECDRLGNLKYYKIIIISLGGMLFVTLLALTLAMVYVRILKQRNRRLLSSDCATLSMTRDEVIRLMLGPIAKATVDVKEPPAVEVLKPSVACPPDLLHGNGAPCLATPAVHDP
ncbi:uncharacterized protein LOC125039829 [Penaeus chinensis]|uniref:uncharacterized protein LOC125039829 n=1 Tax=Penaeus chinensis TaxID=139456 RepID=UPI001FB60A5B|nr:uncharacterized protein LOC125039829 [Penaeus chinensis]